MKDEEVKSTTEARKHGENTRELIHPQMTQILADG